jgi:N-sulfoglucosamine sulfohydrolase
VESVRYDPANVRVPSFLPDAPETRAELAQYYEAVSRLDQGVGRLRRILRETGRQEDTLVIYLSDNGVAFPGAKTTLYDPGIRLPLIVRAPAHRHPGSTQAAMVTWADLTPTLLDIAGAPAAPGECDGRSFRAGLDGARLDGWDEIFASHTLHEVTMYYPMRAIRTRRHKLIWNIAHPLPFPFALDLAQSPTWIGAERRGTTYGPRTIAAFRQRPQLELYDLERDPDEVNNLAGDPTHAALLRDLTARLRDFQRATRDPWLHKWDRG